MKIICIMGKSGSGKSTLESALEKSGYSRMISYTTRTPRGNERDGREYHFVTREQFEKLFENGILMEYAEYGGNLYGSPKPSDGRNVVVVEPQGYERIKGLYPKKTIGVYIALLDEVIAQRISRRKDTSSKEVAKRAAGDIQVFKDIEDKVDLVIDGRRSVRELAGQILRFAGELDEKCEMSSKD